MKTSNRINYQLNRLWNGISPVRCKGINPMALRGKSRQYMGVCTLLLLFVLTTISCGSGDISPPTDRTAQTGVFSDSLVSGISYSTASHQGVTDSGGSFLYEEGEMISFLIGDTILGSALAKPQITPFDIVENAVIPIGNAEIDEALADEESPFQTVINLVVLLQTLDYDGDPENGIEITASVADLFEGVSLDFSIPHDRFRTNPTFRGILNEANDNGYLSSHRAVRSEGLSLDHLYESLDIDPMLFVPSLEQADTDGDGTVDSVRSGVYDRSNNQIRMEEDADNDGVADEVEIYQYDSNGNETRHELDSNGDGTADLIEIAQYDADGNLAHGEIDDDGDGAADYIGTAQHDANGNLAHGEIDEDGDGAVDYIFTYQYDADGNETRYEEDEDGDGTVDYLSTRQYDADGNHTRHERDADGDGTVDYISTRQYDADGNQTRYERDADGNGTVDRVYIRQYDADGNITRETRDLDGDGTADEIYALQYDADGNRIRWEHDADGDGTAESVSTYQYDGNSNLIRRERDTNNDGIVDEIYTYAYQPAGFWLYDAVDGIF